MRLPACHTIVSAWAARRPLGTLLGGQCTAGEATANACTACPSTAVRHRNAQRQTVAVKSKCSPAVRLP